MGEDVIGARARRSCIELALPQGDASVGPSSTGPRRAARASPSSATLAARPDAARVGRRAAAAPDDARSLALPEPHRRRAWSPRGPRTQARATSSSGDVMSRPATQWSYQALTL